jgi:hypothetical protein
VVWNKSFNWEVSGSIVTIVTSNLCPGKRSFTPQLSFVDWFCSLHLSETSGPSRGEWLLFVRWMVCLHWVISEPGRQPRWPHGSFLQACCYVHNNPWQKVWAHICGVEVTDVGCEHDSAFLYAQHSTCATWYAETYICGVVGLLPGRCISTCGWRPASRNCSALWVKLGQFFCCALRVKLDQIIYCALWVKLDQIIHLAYWVKLDEIVHLAYWVRLDQFILGALWMKFDEIIHCALWVKLDQFIQCALWVKLDQIIRLALWVKLDQIIRLALWVKLDQFIVHCEWNLINSFV